MPLFWKPYKSEITNFIDELKAKNIGLVHTNEPYGMNGAEVQKKEITKKGASVFAERAHAPDATDLTESVLATKGADDATVALFHHLHDAVTASDECHGGTVQNNTSSNR